MIAPDSTSRLPGVPMTPVAPGVIGRTALDRLADRPMPRIRCDHLMAADGTPSAVGAVLASWSTSKLRCPPCAIQNEAYLRERPDARMRCDGCRLFTNIWTPVADDSAAVVLVAALCPDCWDADSVMHHGGHLVTGRDLAMTAPETAGIASVVPLARFRAAHPDPDEIDNLEVP